MNKTEAFTSLHRAYLRQKHATEAYRRRLLEIHEPMTDITKAIAEHFTQNGYDYTEWHEYPTALTIKWLNEPLIQLNHNERSVYICAHDADINALGSDKEPSYQVDIADPDLFNKLLQIAGYFLRWEHPEYT
jgi:hypothetical protein